MSKQLKTEKLKTLTAEQAVELVAQYHDALDLSGLTTLSDGVAVALAKHKGNLDLSGLTTLSEGAAVALAKHKGGLHLSPLARSSVDAAAAQGRRKKPNTVASLRAPRLSSELAELLYDNASSHGEPVDYDGNGWYCECVGTLVTVDPDELDHEDEDEEETDASTIRADSPAAAGRRSLSDAQRCRLAREKKEEGEGTTIVIYATVTKADTHWFSVRQIGDWGDPVMKWGPFRDALPPLKKILGKHDVLILDDDYWIATTTSWEGDECSIGSLWEPGEADRPKCLFLDNGEACELPAEDD